VSGSQQPEIPTRASPAKHPVPNPLPGGVVLRASHAARTPLPPADAKRRKSIIRRFAILIVGSIVILVGIAIGILPGPGPILLVPLGLAILATEFEWARRLLNRFKSGAADLATETDRLTGLVSRIWIFPVIAVYGVLVWQAFRVWPEHPKKVLVFGFTTFIPVAYVCYRIAVIRARKQMLRKLWNRVRARAAERKARKSHA